MVVMLAVIARSAATRQSSANKDLDCRTTLAMTKAGGVLAGVRSIA